MTEVSRRLGWALKGVLALAALGIASQMIVIGTLWLTLGPWLLVLLVLPHGTVLAIVVAHLSARDVREPIGHTARRAISYMLAALTLTVDMQMSASDLPAIWWSGAFATMVAMFAIRRAEFGHARYLVPLVVAVPIAALALATREGWYRWVTMAAALLVHATCMAVLQRAGIGTRPATPTT